ncbi:MAG TPA: uroporphyrinogen-III C-methyltransferase [Chthoniobacterales bacterium]
MKSSAKSQKPGICHLAGAGPGDIGLVTLRTKECVEQADVIVYDYLSNPEILSWAKPEAVLVYAGKKAGAHTLTQEEINTVLVHETAAGKRVVRLKGGDPFVFGRGGEEALALADARLPFEIIPGVTSAIAAPAYAGIPVTHRGIAVQTTFFTGHEDPTKPETQLDYASLARNGGTKVLLMGIERLEAITGEMIAKGASKDMPVALVRWGTTPKQETLRGRLENVAQLAREQGFSAPAIAIFGEVVNLRQNLRWFDNRPLFGKRIVVTRSRKQAGALSAELRALGADVLEIPTIRIEPPANLREFAELVRDAHQYDWLVFTSPNAVEAFFDLFYRIYGDAREIGGVRIAAIGPATAKRVADYRFKVDLQPDEFVAEGIIKVFQAEGDIENLRFLLPRAEVTREILAPALTKLGAIVDEAIAYRTVPETLDRTGAFARFQKEGADVITFTSSSTVEYFLAMKPAFPPDVQLASIGPVTSQTLREHGLKPHIEATQHDIPGLVKAILERMG